MLQEGNTANPKAIESLTNVAPIAFTFEHLDYLNSRL
jgi:hypothetical protein